MAVIDWPASLGYAEYSATPVHSRGPFVNRSAYTGKPHVAYGGGTRLRGYVVTPIAEARGTVAPEITRLIQTLSDPSNQLNLRIPGTETTPSTVELVQPTRITPPERNAQGVWQGWRIDFIGVNPVVAPPPVPSAREFRTQWVDPSMQFENGLTNLSFVLRGVVATVRSIEYVLTRVAGTGTPSKPPPDMFGTVGFGMDRSMAPFSLVQPATNQEQSVAINGRVYHTIEDTLSLWARYTYVDSLTGEDRVGPIGLIGTWQFVAFPFMCQYNTGAQRLDWSYRLPDHVTVTRQTVYYGDLDPPSIIDTVGGHIRQAFPLRAQQVSDGRCGLALQYRIGRATPKWLPVVYPDGTVEPTPSQTPRLRAFRYHATDLRLDWSLRYDLNSGVTILNQQVYYGTIDPPPFVEGVLGSVRQSFPLAAQQIEDGIFGVAIRYRIGTAAPVWSPIQYINRGAEPTWSAVPTLQAFRYVAAAARLDWSFRYDLNSDVTVLRQRVYYGALDPPQLVEEVTANVRQTFPLHSQQVENGIFELQVQYRVGGGAPIWTPRQRLT